MVESVASGINNFSRPSFGSKFYTSQTAMDDPATSLAASYIDFSQTGTYASASNGIDSFYRSSIQRIPQALYPPQPSSTGSASPNSNLSASVTPNTLPSPPFPSSTTTTQCDLGLSSLNNYPASHYAASRNPFQYQTDYDYYANIEMSSSAKWFTKSQLCKRFYYSWANHYTFPAEDASYHHAAQMPLALSRRSSRCGCPNCMNELSGLPPIVGPDERGRKQHLCHVPGCERLYSKASHLKTHLRWHTGERPFMCPICDKRFSRSDELQRHSRTHTNYRPYGCPLCSKKFSRSDHLSKHKKTHLKDKTKKAAAVDKSPPKSEPSAAMKTTATVATSAINFVEPSPFAQQQQQQLDQSEKMKATVSTSEVPATYPYTYKAPVRFDQNDLYDGTPSAPYNCPSGGAVASTTFASFGSSSSSSSSGLLYGTKFPNAAASSCAFGQGGSQMQPPVNPYYTSDLVYHCPSAYYASTQHQQ